MQNMQNKRNTQKQKNPAFKNSISHIYTQECNLQHLAQTRCRLYSRHKKPYWLFLKQMAQHFEIGQEKNHANQGFDTIGCIKPISWNDSCTSVDSSWHRKKRGKAAFARFAPWLYSIVSKRSAKFFLYSQCLLSIDAEEITGRSIICSL